MGFRGFGRRTDPNLERQRRGIAHVATEFADLERRFGGLPDLKVSFAGVWEDVPEVEEIRAKLPTMGEMIGLMQSRADIANAELPDLNDALTMLAREIGYGQALLEKLTVTLMTKQGFAASRDRE